MDSQIEAANVFSDAIRAVFSLIDLGVFSLLNIVYQIFFNVASVDFFSNSAILEFYKRVQLILGVFMIFQLALTIIKGIVNPDNFFKNEKNGAGNIITKVAVGLLIFTALIPINTPGSNEYEKNINNNGILFGTLYSLQHRILANNTIEKFILGSSSNEESYISTDGETPDESLKKTSRIFTATVLKAFYRINLLPEDERLQHDDTKDDATFNANRICQDWDSSILNTYTKIDADVGDIIEIGKMKCEGNASGVQAIISAVNPTLAGNSYYYLAVTPLLPSIVGIVFIVLLISFSIDIAVRAAKLAILRIIAPIPIISYMDPNGSKDSSFNAWTKSLASTYVDLFVRLASIYFVIYIIQDMITNGADFPVKTGMISILSYIFVWIGLFVFAKQAPKFIKEILGMKSGNEGGLFSGFATIMGFGAAAAGALGSAATNWRASSAENKELRGNHKIASFFLNAGSAIAGGISGAAVGAKAMTGKDASAKTVIAAQRQRNATRAAHSTAKNRLKENVFSTLTGTSLADRVEDTTKNAETFVKAQGNWKKALEAQAIKKHGEDSVNFTLRDGSTINADFNMVKDQLDRGSKKINIGGAVVDATLFAPKTISDAQKIVVSNYLADTAEYTKDTARNGELYQVHEDVRTAAKKIDWKKAGTTYDVDRPSTHADATHAVEAVIVEHKNDMRQVMRNAAKQRKK